MLNKNCKLAWYMKDSNIDCDALKKNNKRMRLIWTTFIKLKFCTTIPS